jgi:hypothetical protein
LWATDALLGVLTSSNAMADALQQLRQAQARLSSKWGSAQWLELISSLRSAGLALMAPAVVVACNNDGCRDVSMLTELDLAKSAARCGSCLAARYCSRECSRQHWKQHKPVCVKKSS